MTPQNFYLLLCFLALLLMPLFIYSYKPQTYPIDSFFFITSFPIINLADSASIIFFKCVPWPMIISLLWLGLLFLSCLCCYNNLMISNPLNSYSICDHQRISPKMSGHFVFFKFSSSNCQSSALLRRLIGSLSTLQTTLYSYPKHCIFSSQNTLPEYGLTFPSFQLCHGFISSLTNLLSPSSFSPNHADLANSHPSDFVEVLHSQAPDTFPYLPL